MEGKAFDLMVLSDSFQNGEEMKIVVEFERDKETPGTIRYRELSDAPRVGTIYIKKFAAEKMGNPDKLIVEIKGI